MHAELHRRAEAWLAEDPDPATRAELAALLAADDEAAVAERFAGRLEFGTAGLRGPLRAGPAGMNRAVVRRTAAGLAAHLGGRGRVVVGYDARHGSAAFAEDSCAVLAGAGCEPLLLPRPLPTPVLAFAVRHLAAAAGVMVTASHNPPQDNGYKVYTADGAQIVPPTDAAIAAAIEAVGPLAAVPLASAWPVLGDDVLTAYLDAVAELAGGSARDVTIAYTPLHGVGRDVLLAALARAGFPPPVVVAEQADPDPDFPTVSFPNPEEPGALDHALALAADIGADVLLANDPDADRLAMAVPTTAGWRVLTGDETGGLLAEHVLRHTAGPDRTVSTTIVSSSLLRSLAPAYGATAVETLTGFKWIVRAPGRLIFGYEEALGLAVGDDAGLRVRDKDGIGAAVAAAGLVAELKAAGRTVLDELDEQARRFGLHATAALSVRVTDLGQIAAVMARLREQPPSQLAGRPVTAADDLRDGAVTGLPPTDGIRWRLAGGARVVVRPSGTEPKLKAYLEVVVPVPDGDVSAARQQAADELAALRDAVAALTGLDRPG